MRILTCLLIVGCNPTGETLVEKVTPAENLEDSGSTTEQEPSTGDQPEDTEEPPPQVFSNRWEGTRDITFPDICTDTLRESGLLVDEEEIGQQLLSTCGECIHIYEIEVNPNEICGSIPVSTTVYRGVSEPADDSFSIFAFYQNENGGVEYYEMSLAERSQEAWQYTYDGTYNSYTYNVEGVVNFP